MSSGTDLSWASAIVQSFEPYSFVRFHREQLPELVERRGHLVAADLAGVPPLAFRCNGIVFTWVAKKHGVEVREGDVDAATVVELSEETFSEFLHELLTVRGAGNTGRARVVRGDLAGWQHWEPAIQSLCSGREIYGPSSITSSPSRRHSTGYPPATTTTTDSFEEPRTTRRLPTRRPRTRVAYR